MPEKVASAVRGLTQHRDPGGCSRGSLPGATNPRLSSSIPSLVCFPSAGAHLGLPANMEAQGDTLCLLAQPKEGQQQFENKKQPELRENRTVWKSDNQGDKEDTLTQTGRRGGDGQPDREDSRQGGGWWTQRGGGLWSRVGKTAAGHQGSSWWTG